MKKVLVVGGAGSLGQLIIKEFINTKEAIEIYIGDYKLDRVNNLSRKLDIKGIYVNKNDIKALEESFKLNHFDLIIIATNQTYPHIEEVANSLGIDTINVEAYKSIAHKFKANSQNSAHLFMTGFVPGLSGIFIKSIFEKVDSIEKLNFSLLQNTNGTNGIRGVYDMLNIINKNKNWKNSFNKKDIFEIYDNRYITREIAHDEEDILREYFGSNHIRYFTGWNNNAFTNFIAFIKNIKLLNLLHKNYYKWKLHKYLVNNEEVENEECYLNINYIGLKGSQRVEGQETLKAYSDYGLTANIIVISAIKLLNNNYSGSLYPLDILYLDEILSEISPVKLKKIN